MRIFYIVILIVYLFSSCFPGKYKLYFNQCYNPQDNGIDSVLRIDGYYFGNFSDDVDSKNGYSIMLFHDGSVVVNVHLNKDNSGNLLDDEMYLSCWGTYVYNGKILKCQTFHSTMSSSGLRESSYRIINDTTLWKIRSKIMSGNSIGKIFYNDSTSNRYIEIMNFIKLESKPDSSCRLKEKKWFWCDKEKYKGYMKKLKEEKRNNKE
jgi:hypothetical protein